MGIGGSGLGKTHMARAVGYRLCQKGVRVLYTGMSAMTLALATADATGNLKRTMEHYTQPALLIIDRLVERSEVFHLEGKSYRETHRQRLKT